VVMQAFRMFGYFILTAPHAQRMIFFRNLKRTWLQDKRLIKRSFTLLAQYRHFFDFVNKMKKADQG
jgi:hypothetical protein